MEGTYQPNVAIIIRTKNDGQRIPRLLESIAVASKGYGGRIDTIFVDTESEDSTIDAARAFGATIVSITQREFTYPKSLNRGLAAVAADVEAAFLTVGHALPVSPLFIKEGISHFEDPDVSGVYGVTVPYENSSPMEKLIAPRVSRNVREISKIIMGTFGATNALIRVGSWRNHPFDEAYAGGGEDTEWARRALDRGEKILYDPILNVRHGHGLSLVASIRQWLHWRAVLKGPTAFNQTAHNKKNP